MSQYYHLCLSVTGALRLSEKDFRKSYHGLFQDSSGRVLSDAEARKDLLNELAKGHRVIPFGECDNFDYQKGCQGHEQPEGGEG